MDRHFSEALEAAIVSARKRERMFMGLLTVGAGVMMGVGYLMTGFPLAGILVTVIVALGWWAVLTDRGPVVRDLAAMRGATIEGWWPSPNHGLIAHTSSAVLLGHVGALWFVPEKIHQRKLKAVSYDETQHALIVTSIKIFIQDGEEREQVKQHRVELDKSVTPDEAFAAARLLDQRGAK